MDWETSFDEYLEHLCNAIGHSDRRAGLVGYCQGLMLPIARKSVEPLAAHIEPHRVSARHQSLHHFVSKLGGIGSFSARCFRDSLHGDRTGVQHYAVSADR